LTKQERAQALSMLFMISTMALLEAVGVASILPFIGVLTNPNLIENNPVLFRIYKSTAAFGVSSVKQFMIVLGLGVFAFYVTSTCFKALTTYTLLRFGMMQEFGIGQRLIERYLRQPYGWYLNKNSAVLGKTILSEINLVTRQAIIPTLTLFSQWTVIVAILLLLILIDPILALTVGLIIGIA
jgi:ATP-binding cassette, subfamily B, bacterial PglK